jgi:stress-induced morphogen
MASPDAPTAAAASSNGSGAGSSLSQGSATAQADGAAADSPNRQQSNSAASTSGAAAAAAITTPPAGSSTPVQDSIRRKLTEALAPVRLEVHDDSAQHAGHAGSRMQAGYSGETHFRVDVASSAFQGLKTLKQHRLVYDVRLLVARVVLTDCLEHISRFHCTCVQPLYGGASGVGGLTVGLVLCRSC